MARLMVVSDGGQFRAEILDNVFHCAQCSDEGTSGGDLAGAVEQATEHIEGHEADSAQDEAPAGLHVDADGDRWERAPDGRYRYASHRMPYLNLTLPLADVVERFGSYGEPVSEEGNGVAGYARMAGVEQLGRFAANLARELGQLQPPTINRGRWPRQRDGFGNTPDPGAPLE